MSDLDYNHLKQISLAELLKQDKSLLEAFARRTGYKFGNYCFRIQKRTSK